MKHEIRLMALDEQPLVVDAWVRSFRDSPYAGCIGNDHFQAAQRRTVEDILLRPETRALVAIAPGPTKRVMGFVVFGGDCFHFLYVKRAYRDKLFAVEDALLAELPKNIARYSFRPHKYRHIEDRGWRWDPVAARL